MKQQHNNKTIIRQKNDNETTKTKEYKKHQTTKKKNSNWSTIKNISHIRKPLKALTKKVSSKQNSILKNLDWKTSTKPLPAQVGLRWKKKKISKEAKKGPILCKKPGESNRDLFRALRGGV